MKIDFDVVNKLLPKHRYSVRAVAKVLGIHHNTLQYRINHEQRFKKADHSRAAHQREFIKALLEIRRIAHLASISYLKETKYPIKLGRPSTVEIDLNEVAQLLPKYNYSVRKVAKALNVSQSTLHHRLKNSCIRVNRDSGREFKAAQIFVRQIAHKASLNYLRHELPVKKKVEAGVGKIFCADPQGKIRACYKCNLIQPLANFYFHYNSGVYKRSCKECERQRARVIWNERGRFNRVRVRVVRLPPLSEVYPYAINEQSEGFDLLTRINSLVPRNIPELVRADVCQSLALAVLSGEIDPANLAEHIKEYAKSQYAFLPSKFQISLDAPLFSDGQRYSLVDSISTDEYADRWASSKGFYGDAISDCESAEDYAERLRDAWDANRLTERRRTYSEFSADHHEDNRSRVAAGVSSAPGGMYVNVRRWRPIPPSRIGIERRLDELAYSTEDYLDHRIAEEAGRECSLDCFCRRHEQHSTNEFQQASKVE